MATLGSSASLHMVVELFFNLLLDVALLLIFQYPLRDMVTIPDFHMLVVDVPVPYIVRLDSACPGMCFPNRYVLDLLIMPKVESALFTTLFICPNSVLTHMPRSFLIVFLLTLSALLLIICNFVYYFSYLDAYIYISWCLKVTANLSTTSFKGYLCHLVVVFYHFGL